MIGIAWLSIMEASSLRGGAGSQASRKSAGPLWQAGKKSRHWHKVLHCRTDKHRFHRGERRPIHFYRDASGLEADILIDHGTHRTIVEAKAAKTVSEDALASTKRVASAIGDEFPARRVVIYGGDERKSRSDVDVLPWREIHSVDWV